jgi:D-glycero-D-manno-heptose 1,7-bisphosphate phosphatase
VAVIDAQVRSVELVRAPEPVEHDPKQPFVARFDAWARRPSGAARRPFVFLDKDGTLVEDLPYNVDPRRVRFVQAADDAIGLFADAGLPLAICSNQSGVARGYYSLQDLGGLARHLHDELAVRAGELAAMYACPHLPRASGPWAIVCDCRKPATGLLTRAADELGADLAASWMIGDTWMDVAAGKSAGCRAILVGPEWRTAGSLPAARRPDAAVPDLLGAARIITGEAA